MFRWLFRKKKTKPREAEVKRTSAAPDSALCSASAIDLGRPKFDGSTIDALAREVGDTYYAWLFRANYESQQPPSQRVEKQLKALESRLKNAGVEDLGLPRQPNILPKLMSIMRDKSSSSDRLVDLISSDAGFTVKVLSMANSPFFRVTEEPITDIKRALIYLGENGLQRLVTTALLQPILVLKSKSSKVVSEKLYGHVFLCAEIGAWLAADSIVSPQTLHLLGLLQGTGNISLLSFVDAYRQQEEEGGLSKGELQDKLDEEENAWLLSQLFQRHSSRLAYVVARHWELGPDIEAALAYVAKPGDQKRRNETSELLLASVLASYVKLLVEEDLIGTEQAEEWLTAVCVPRGLLDKTFTGN